MSYESMIKLFTKDMQLHLVEEEEKQIVKAVQEIGFNINREELIRTLEYDRDQYKKGYEDRDAEIVRCKDCKHWYADADTGMACEFTNMGQPEDGYCNWGERKGGDDE